MDLLRVLVSEGPFPEDMVPGIDNPSPAPSLEGRDGIPEAFPPHLVRAAPVAGEIAFEEGTS